MFYNCFKYRPKISNKQNLLTYYCCNKHSNLTLIRVITKDENKWWSNYHHLVVKNYGKMVIFVKNYVKMLKSKTFYLLKFRLTWPIE